MSTSPFLPEWRLRETFKTAGGSIFGHALSAGAEVGVAGDRKRIAANIKLCMISSKQET